MNLSLADITEVALYYSYDASRRGDGSVAEADVHTRSGRAISEHQAHLAFKNLSASSFVDVVPYPSKGRIYYRITSHGYLETEKLIKNGTSLTSRLEKSEGNLQRAQTDTTQNRGDGIGAIPAADRIVTLDHNRPEYSDGLGALDEIIHHVGGINDPEFRTAETDRFLAEARAARALLEAPQVGILVLDRLVLTATAELAKRFANHMIGSLIAEAARRVSVFVKWLIDQQ